MAFDFSKLNKQQQDAVFQTKGPVIVTAGAGTGKTRLLTHRIAYLIQHENVDPSNILAITFTNKATGEMRERIVNNLDRGNLVTVSTFHSLCVKILRKNIFKLNENYNQFFTIYDDADQDKILKKIIKENNEEDDFRKVVSYYISKAKNEGITPADFKDKFFLLKDADEILKYYELYEQSLKKNNALDFDDLILKTILLFKKCPEVLSYYQNKFQFIHIDEFQDTNTVQYDLAFLLAKQHRNILVVGDEDQSIYGWRGANYKNLFKFCDDFKEAKLFKLEQNYRSTTAIIEKANKLISKNNERFDKVLFTEKNNNEDVDFKCFDSDLLEADFVARYIKKAVQNGACLSDFAVLYRVNSVSRLFENAFVNNSIPYIVYGGLKFYSRAEIKNMLAYLRLLINPNDNEAFARIINFPKRGVGKVTLDSVFQASQQANKSCLNFILNSNKEFKNKGIEQFKNLFIKLKQDYENNSLSNFCNNLINQLQLSLVYGSGSEEDLAKLLNIKSFIVAINEFEASNPELTLTDFLENVSLSSEVDDVVSDSVVLATVHAVKGLEFKVVFVVGCEENMFPFAKSIDEGNIEEERRLMYVAITRAEEKLILTCAKRRFSYGGGFDNFSIKSRFIKEIGLNDFSDNSDYKFKERINNHQFNSSNNKSIQSANEFIKNISQLHKATELYSKSQNEINKYKVGTRVLHVRFGEGKIVNLNDNVAEIEFENGSKKQLNLEFAPLDILEE